MSKVLVTGGAGFIGYYLSRKLIENYFTVIIIDNLDDYYDIDHKLRRLSLLGVDKNKIQYGKEVRSKIFDKLLFMKADIRDFELIKKIFSENSFKYVAHLAARSGARSSFDNPKAYVENNIDGFVNILEFSSKNKVDHLLFTSSSSVYGDMDNKNDTAMVNPKSLYGASKLSAEIIAKTYSKAKDLPVTIARLFSVYGPLGRPDGFVYKCLESIKKDQTIELYNNGNMWRDFIYIEDVVEMLFRLILTNPRRNFEIYDIGTGFLTKITEVIELIEKKLNKQVLIEKIPSVNNENIKIKALNPIQFRGISLLSLEQGLEKYLKEFFRTSGLCII